MCWTESLRKPFIVKSCSDSIWPLCLSIQTNKYISSQEPINGVWNVQRAHISVLLQYNKVSQTFQYKCCAVIWCLTINEKTHTQFYSYTVVHMNVKWMCSSLEWSDENSCKQSLSDRWIISVIIYHSTWQFTHTKHLQIFTANVLKQHFKMFLILKMKQVSY